MHWNKAASTILPGCLVLLSKSTIVFFVVFFFFFRADWVTQCVVKIKKKKVKGQIANAGHLWPGTMLFSTQAPRKPASQKNCWESLWCNWKVPGLGLGRTDWKLCCWWAVWPKPNLSKFLFLENGNNINNDAPPAYFSLPHGSKWFLSVIHSRFNPIYFSRYRNWGTAGWSGTIIVTGWTRGRARIGVGASELSLHHHAEYTRTHGHLLSDFLAALGSTGIFFFPPSNYFWNTSLQFSCPNGL